MTSMMASPANKALAYKTYKFINTGSHIPNIGAHAFSELRKKSVTANVLDL